MKRNSTKRALISSLLALLLCVSMFVGTTFAWFTDSVTSAGNKIVSGNLKVDLEVLGEDNATWTSVRDMRDPIFNYQYWEPGYTQMKILKVENEGSLALKWKAMLVSSDGKIGDLAKVIDVYVIEDITAYPTDRASLDGWTKVGTLYSFIENVEQTTNGTLEANTSETLGIAFKMHDNAGNEYQNASIGTFDIKIVATQQTSESDSFDKTYDEGATLDGFIVSSLAELIAAIESGETEITLADNILVTEAIKISTSESITINGNGNTLKRDAAYTGNMMDVSGGAALTLENVKVDGGAVWTGEIDETLGRGTVNSGIRATGNIVALGANSALVLEDGAVLANNDGAHAVNLGTRVGATLTIDGGEIVNNNSDSGAVWGGGHIVMNNGKINCNSSTGIGGAIRMVSSCNLTVNGGEMNNNKAATDGGVIWGYGSSNYNFNGGEMSNNVSAGTGGAIYTGTYSTITISGDFEMLNNKAANSGAIRLTDHTSLTMTGGTISGNTQNGGESNAFNTWNNTIVLTGGLIADNISYVGGLGLTVGAADIDGVIAYNLSTNHNTAYLTADFSGFKFTVNESNANFASFNFKPEAGYVYVSGDEDKLVCLNDGYETYWDAATSTFRLQAKATI